jgi:ABC-type multidrug transport system fused ATPase/permease subunit
MTFYAVWGVAQGIFQFINGFYFSVAGAKAAKVLHHRALKNIFRAPTSFFDTTPLGRIINRFSKDVDSCDNLLSESYRMFTGTGSIVLSTFILIAVIFPYFLIPLVPMLIFYYFAAVYYRASSRELKRLDAIIRSSLYAHFAETLSGLATIRAYREQERFINRNAYFLDMENRPYYLSYAIQRWLGVRLEAIANVLILSTALLGVCGRFTIATATIGLVLSYSMSVTGTFNWCVRQYAEVVSCEDPGSLLMSDQSSLSVNLSINPAFFETSCRKTT